MISIYNDKWICGRIRAESIREACSRKSTCCYYHQPLEKTSLKSLSHRKKMWARKVAYFSDMIFEDVKMYADYNFFFRTYKKSHAWFLPGFDFRIRSHIPLLEAGSTPDVGSSRITVLELAMKAMATESFLFIPPDKLRDCSCRLSVSPTSSRNLQNYDNLRVL